MAEPRHPLRLPNGRVSNQIECLVPATHEIGEWHIGHWIDWGYTGIQTNFDTAVASLAKSTCYEAPTATQ